MIKNNPQILTQVEHAVDAILAKLGKRIVMATPLGLGKPNQLINALYQRAKNDTSISLKIITALSLAVPKPRSDLEKRFAEPFLKRVYDGYVELDYVIDIKRKAVPANIEVCEFYFKAGDYLSNPAAQQNYISSNYTHVARDIVANDVNLILQMVAIHDDSQQAFSLSCNPDVSLDLAAMLEAKGLRDKVFVVAQTHSELPYMQQDAEVAADFFDIIVDNREYDTTLFSVPNTTVSLTDHLIGLHASTLIKDAGTLQIGIGAMADAIVHSCNLRHTNNAAYLASLDAFEITARNRSLINEVGGVDKFEKGLYGSSEMFVNGFRYLIDSGVVSRKVYSDIKSQRQANAGVTIDAQDGVYMHGGFFLGPSDFYQWLRDLTSEQQAAICMTSVLNVNQLDADYELLAAQRQHARFINSGLMACTNGAVVSDGLETGQVLSGVGGQYNFVSMAHKLPDARSILMIRATRTNSKGEVSSNIRHEYGHVTIPRHLRDIVITEYGIADLRSKSDKDVYKAMLNIADSQFQEELLEQAKQYGKIESNYRIPTEFKNNTPQMLKEKLSLINRAISFPLYPFGEEFTDEEEDLILALQQLKLLSYDKVEFAKESIKALFSDSTNEAQGELLTALKRMGLDKPEGYKEKITGNLLAKLLKKST